MEKKRVKGNQLAQQVHPEGRLVNQRVCVCAIIYNILTESYNQSTYLLANSD